MVETFHFRLPWYSVLVGTRVYVHVLVHIIHVQIISNFASFVYIWGRAVRNSALYRDSKVTITFVFCTLQQQRRATPVDDGKQEVN